jgi:hypothetical protein
MPYDVGTTLPPKPHRGRLTEEEEEAYVESLTDDQKVYYDQQRRQREASRDAGGTSIGGTRRTRRRSADGLDADVTVTELSGILKLLLKSLVGLLRSDAEIDTSELDDMARGFLVIINRIDRLKIVVRMLTPGISALQLASKLREIMNGRRQQKREQSNQQAA